MSKIKIFDPETYWYNASISRYTAIFGSVFSGMMIERKAKNKKQSIKVPIIYGKKYFYSDTPQDEQSRDQNKIKTIYPSMSFEIESFDLFPSTRMENKHNMISRNTLNGNETRNVQFKRKPIDIFYRLRVATKNLDDALQILEQISSTFKPNLNISVKDIDGNLVDVNKQDINITLEGNPEFNDSGEVDEESRIIEMGFSFKLEGYIYSKTIEAPTINEIEIRAIIEDGEWFNFGSYTEKPQSGLIENTGIHKENNEGMQELKELNDSINDKNSNKISTKRINNKNK